MDFKSWVRNDEGWGTVGAIVKGGLNVAAQAMNMPTPDELGVNTDGVGHAVKTAAAAVKDHFRSLTPEELKSLEDRCFVKKQFYPCQILCNKVGNEKACAKVGKTKIGRRWVTTDLSLANPRRR